MQVAKPINFKITKSENHALLVQIDDMDRFYTQFHQHPEFQITAIVKGEGLLYAGNSMISYTENDVLFVGSNVPHLFKTSPLQSIRNINGVKGISLFFDLYSFGHQFFDLKEMVKIRAILSQSTRVIKILGELKEEIFEKIVKTPDIDNEKLVITFLEILSLIVEAEKEFINPVKYEASGNGIREGRLNEVLEYTFTHSDKEITVEEIASVAHLSKSQFSHFFKLHTGKSFIQFLNELRIENACILLKEDYMTINQVCYSVGFKNISNFNRQFKKYKDVTPSTYRKNWVI